jgi:hypothetical protein
VKGTKPADVMPGFKYSEQLKFVARATQQTNASAFLEDILEEDILEQVPSIAVAK